MDRDVLSRVISSRFASRAATNSSVRSSSWMRRPRLGFERCDALVEPIDVVRRTEARVTPGLLPDQLGQAMFEVLHTGSQAAGAVLGSREVGLQRRPGHGEDAPAVFGGRASRACSCSSRPRWR